MKKPNKQQTIHRTLRAVWRYVLFFLSISLIISCCMVLFLNRMTQAMGIVLTADKIEQAAKATFANVVLLSLLCTVLDGVRRKFMIDRPVKRITDAAEKLMKGDFSTRIRPLHSLESADGFDVIIDYFNKMAEELSGTETLRTDFIANVSHELKTPLSVIQNYGAMLRQPELPEETRQEYAKAIMDASRRLANLISNILKLNKLENQQIFPFNKTFHLGEQLCECLLTFESAWEKKGLNIETEIEDDVSVEADAELLNLVWNNLFSNAVKFTQDGGTVTLRLKTEGENAVVQVADTGCGISKDVGEHMFEKFYQGDPSHATQGNGLGLALVKRVIAIVGGDIFVTSEVGRGSTFTVTLRRKKNEAVPENSK